MKKIFSKIMIFLLIVSSLVIFGCKERYGDLRMSLTFCFTSFSSRTLEDGTKRWTNSTDNSVVDENLDGSYTLYMYGNNQGTAYLDATFTGTPDDFNNDISVSLSNSILTIGKKQYIDGGIRFSVTPNQEGSTVLTVLSSEGDRQRSVNITVAQVPSILRFKESKIALSYKSGTTTNLADGLENNLSFGMKNVTFELGTLAGEGETSLDKFVPYSSIQLAAKNISLNSGVLTLLEDYDLQEGGELYVRATYQNPLGDDLVQLQQIEFLPQITNFEIYTFDKDSSNGLGSKVGDSNNILSTINFVTNIAITHKDFVLRVNTNGKKLNIFGVEDSLCPFGVSVQPNYENYGLTFGQNSLPIRYFNADGEITTEGNIHHSTYALCYIRLVPSKVKSTEGSANYPQGTYDMLFRCEYVDYKNEEFATSASIRTKCYTVVNNYAINGKILQNNNIEASFVEDNCLATELMTNFDASLGVKLSLTVGEPLNVLSNRTAFQIKFYKRQKGSPTISKLSEDEVLNMFQISIDGEGNLLQSGFEGHKFLAGTNFYFKIKQAGEAFIGDDVFMQVESCEEQSSAKCVVKLSLVQGISEITGYELVLRSREVDEATGDYIIYDRQSVTFENARASLDLDLSKGYVAELTLSVFPLDATLSNVYVSSLRDNVVKAKVEGGKIILDPQSVGKNVAISLGSSNLRQTYSIEVNVYYPVVSMDAEIVDISSNSSIGDYTIGTRNIYAKVKAKEQVNYLLTTRPYDAKRYDMTYTVFDITSGKDVLVKTPYTVYHDGRTTGSSKIFDDCFELNCKANAFMFTSDLSNGKTYVVQFKLENLDGTTLEWSFTLSSYVPVEEMDINLSRVEVFDPQSVAYEQKLESGLTFDLTNPPENVFGFDVKVNKTSGRIPTKTFEEKAYVTIRVDGNIDSVYEVTNGTMVKTSGDSSVLKLLFEGLFGGKYWFELEDNSKNISTIQIEVKVVEFRQSHYARKNISVLKHEQVTDIFADGQTTLRLRDTDINGDINIPFEIANEKAYNKNLVVQTVSVVTVAGRKMYVVAGRGVATSSVQNKTNMHATLTISPTGLAGRTMIVTLPQDKIYSKAQYEIFCGEMREITLSENDFVAGVFYVQNAGEYEVANEYTDGRQYYAKVIDYSGLLDIWEKTLVVQLDVENGEDVPYSVSSVQDLLNISQNPTKRYVLTNNIRFDSSKAFSPIGGYFEVDITEEQFASGIYYIKNNLNQFVLQTAYRTGQTYYAYGFGGELSGRYEVQDKNSASTHYEYYSIENIYLPSQISSKTFGLFETLHGKVSDIDIKFVFAQPNIANEISFGGIAGINFGEISNCTASFSGAILKTNKQTVFGGIAGVNFGKIELSKGQSSSRSLTGDVKIVSSGSELLSVGGISGLNFGEVVGSFARQNAQSVSFGDSSYDCNINITVQISGNENVFDEININSIPSRIVKMFENLVVGGKNENSSFFIPQSYVNIPTLFAMDRDYSLDKTADGILSGIGGAVGTNFGKISNLSVQGNIIAEDCDYVGGIAGLTVANEKYNSKITDLNGNYSISYSYASSHVLGHHYVGGAVGAARGFLKSSETVDENVFDIPVGIYDVGAENYVDDEHSRNFVVGKGEVGGFAGKLVGVSAQYLSVTSYHDEYTSQGTTWLANQDNYDIVANETSTGFNLNEINDGLAGGFAGSSDHAKFFACGANVNLWAPSSIASFIFSYMSNEGEYNVANIFGRGVVNASGSSRTWGSLGAGVNFGNNTLSYSKVIDKAGKATYYVGNTSYSETQFTEQINAKFESSLTQLPWKAEKDSSGNVSGLPMLYISYDVKVDETTTVTKTEPLFVLGPVTVNVVTKDNLSSDEGWKFVKLDDKTLMLFFAVDEQNSISSSILTQINTTKLLELLDITVSPSGAKANKLIVQSSSDLLEVSGENIIVKSVGKEGSETVTLTISSMLSSQNSTYNAKVQIILCYGLSDVNIYANTSFTAPLSESLGIDLLLSETQTVYANPEFVVEVSGEEVSLRAMDNVGLRFEVPSDDITPIIESLNGTATSIGNIFTIGSKQWSSVVSNGKIEKYYVNIDSTFASFIPLLAIPAGAKLNIKCVPYIYQVVDGERKNFLLEEHATNFYLSISHGATSISLSNNTQPNFVMNQLQTLSFTVNMATDSIDDKIILDNLLGLSDDLGINVGEYQYEFVDEVGKVEIVGATETRGKTGLRKISQSFTIWFKDKLAGIKQDKNYVFNFYSSINASVGVSVNVKVIGENEVKSIYTNVYADYDDFPQKSSGGYIYSGLNDSPAVLGVEVYPYVTNYSTVRLSYTSSTGDLLFMSPITLDLKNEHGRQFVDNASVAVIGNDGKSLTIDKSVGQDTFLSNDNGVYSYARSYFFKLFTDSTVTEGTQFVLKIEIINEQGTVILTKEEIVYTLKKPGITFGFDKSLLKDGNDTLYYLPLNTKNELSVETINSTDNIKWSLSAVDERGNAYEKFSEIKETLEPTKENGKYYVQVLKYGEIFTTDLVGKTVTLRGEITNNKQTYSYEIKFVVTLFTVKDISVQNAENNSLKVKVATTTPLKLNVSAYYDESINAGSSWYDDWYENVGSKAGKEADILYKNLTNAGYEVKQYFVDYLNDFADSVAKVTKDNDPLSSGVFKNNGENLKSGNKYFEETFGVEKFKDYFALYGLRANRTFNIVFDSNISYSAKNTLESKSAGVPNVCDYLSSSYDKIKSFTQTIDVMFVYATELRNAIPVSTVDEFLSMEEGKDYRLVNDIVLENYTPLSTKIGSFDGNNKVIFIKSFSYNSSSTGNINLGLFEKIESEVEVSGVKKQIVIQNTTVYYTPNVTEEIFDNNGEIIKILEPSLESLRISLPNASSVVFGGIASSNAGVITNANVLGGVRIEINSSDVVSGGTATSTVGGLVATNERTGYITNSAVGAKLFRSAVKQTEDTKTYDGFNIYCYGKVGGFVGTNNGKIVASYFESGSIEHNSKEEGVGGFVQTNNGEILECFVQGRRSENDKDIRNTGSGIVSRAGIVGGFVYSNNGTISDCYSNIWLSSSGAIAGFVYVDSSSSVISRSYSISYKKAGDNNTTAYPFAGPKTLLSTEVCINGIFNDCFFLNDRTKNDQWGNTNFYTEGSSDPEKTPANKKAVELSTANFATHTYFTNYDLSLVYNTSGQYANDEMYNYVDGYTWAIIEGKPVLASTLVRTISQRDYQGKKKNYTGYTQIFELRSTSDWKSAKRESDPSITDYTNASSGKLLFSKQDNGDTVDFIYPAVETVNGNFESLVITYQVVKNGGKTTYTNPVAEYGEEKRVLDIQEGSINDESPKDSNFRANDTITVTFDYENNFISSITYYTLDENNITYYYSGNTSGTSFASGNQTNPVTIYDRDSLVYALTNTVSSDDTLDKYFRIICDIDIDGEFLSTSKTNFTGVMQGNHMTINNLSMSYNRWQADQVDKEAFGMFAKITSNEEKDTIISNLKLGIVQIVSNVHPYVGALAGIVSGSSVKTDKKVLFNNISIVSADGGYAPVQGRNVVGGLAGYIGRNVIIKDITTDVSVISAYDASGDSSETVRLYIADKSNLSSCSYVGGVVGVFDATSVVDSATKKNYNASNVTVLSGNAFLGGVVGTAFGLLGTDAIANYINIEVESNDTSFIKSRFYGGGIVGENRGILLSSSARNIGEDDSTVSIGKSTLAQYNYFFNAAGTQTIAVGGLAGLNNGGLISNCISTIDVRSSRTSIVGGAVGRQLAGGIENVIVSGSVMGDKIIGGLVGTFNDREMISSAESTFSEEAMMKEDSVHLSLSGTESTEGVICRISNCIAENNWLYEDYDTYIRKINSITKIAVGGFIGLISTINNPSADGKETLTWEDKIVFDGQSTYVGAISNGTSKKYLKAAYVNSTFDYAKGVKEDEYTILCNSQGVQAVFPAEQQELYISTQSSDISYTIRRIPFTKYTNKSSEGNEYKNIIYVFENTDKTFSEDPKFYQAIKIFDIGETKRENFKNKEPDTWYRSDGEKVDYTWFAEHFGIVYEQYEYYYKSDKTTVTGIRKVVDYNNMGSEDTMVVDFGNTYDISLDSDNYYKASYIKMPESSKRTIVVNSETGETGEEYPDTTKSKTTFCYIARPTISDFTFDRTFEYKSGSEKVETINDIAVYGVDVADSKTGACSYANVGDLITQNTFVINGLKLFELDVNKGGSEDRIGLWTEVEENSNIYKLSDAMLEVWKKKTGDDSWHIDLPDGGKIVDVTIHIAKSDVDRDVYVSKVVLTYEYSGVVVEDSSSKATFLKQSQNAENPLVTTYSLISSSKKSAFKSFDSGYWIFADDFYSGVVTFASKYPQNIEYAETYVWEDFRTSATSGLINEINTAEELALFAYLVNNGNTYANTEVRLTADIDLSGKYWIPIGTSANPFKGTFNGQGHTIKYISVDENSLANSQQTKVEYAGLFGCISGAEISSLILLGGETKGNYAGGLAGMAAGSKIKGVVNRNNVIGDSYAGGLVGQATDSTFESCINYAEVKSSNIYDSTVVYVGGLVGQMTDGEIKTTNGIETANNGTVQAQSTHNNHFAEHLVSLYAGGIAGCAENTTISCDLKNYGNVNVVTNAANLWAGGLFGRLNTTTCAGMFNKGKVSVVNSNRNTTDTRSKMYIGGNVGEAITDMSQMSNEEDVKVACDLVTRQDSYVGGIAGLLSGNLSESYNAKNITFISKGGDAAYVAGLAGYVSCAEGKTVTVVSNCYNSGKVTTTCGGVGYVAGIVGLCEENSTNHVVIQYTLSIGQISTQSGEGTCLTGAITNYTANTKLIYRPESYIVDEAQAVSTFANFFLRGTAVMDGQTQEGLGGNLPSDYEEEKFAKGRISTTLKEESTYNPEGEKKPAWNFGNGVDPAIWEWKYATWYPTLVNNSPNTIWTDSVEDMVQVGGDYVIDTPEQLAKLALLSNSGTFDTKGKTFRLRNAIDLSNKLWIPIGTEEFPFEGTFEGGGYSVYNMTVDGTAVVLSGVTGLKLGGLFGVVKNSKIANLGVISPIVKNVNNAAAVVSKANNTLIQNVYTEVSEAKSCGIVGDIVAGGIVCNLEDSLDTQSAKLGLHTSYNNVPVEANAKLTTATQCVGGLVASLKNSSVVNSYNGANGLISIGNPQKPSETVMVIGKQENGKVVNVFNICTNGGKELTATPAMFEIVDGVLKKVDGEGVNPVFANLTDSTSDGKKSTIWAKEYSLNPQGSKGELYPSLRGVGLEWKNTECDSLLSFSTQVDGYKSRIRTAAKATDIMFAEEVLGAQELSSKDSSINQIYLISTPQELAWLSLAVNSGMRTSHCEFILTANIDLSGRFFTPIGQSEQTAFCGVFNFNGHTISGLTIDNLSYNYAGLFGWTSNAYIINGYVKDAFVKVESSTSTANMFVGTVVGYANNTTIKNISVATAVLAKNVGKVYVGGVAGYVSGTIQYKMENILSRPSTKTLSAGENYIDLSDYNTRIYEEDSTSGASKLKDFSINIGGISLSERVFAGGIVGFMSNYNSEATLAGMSYCTNESNVVAMSVGSQPANVYGGGVAGYLANQMAIEACQNSGAIKTSSTLFDAVGGIVGYMFYGTMRNCYSTGYVESCLNSSIKGETSSGSIFSYIGGIVGISIGGTITHTISQSSTYQDVLTGKNIAVGGIIGYSRDKDDFSGDVSVLFNGVGNFGSAAKGIGLSDPALGDKTNAYTMGVDSFQVNAADQTLFQPSYWSGTSSSIHLKSQKAYIALTSVFAANISLFDKTTSTRSPLVYQEQGNTFRGLLADIGGDYSLEIAKDSEMKAITLTILKLDGTREVVTQETKFDTSESVSVEIANYVKDAVCIFVTVVKN